MYEIQNDDCLINEAAEEALCAVTDPEDKCNEKSPGEYWFEVTFDNPLL